MKYRKTTLKIIALFSAAIFATFIPELMPSFFGDWVCEGGQRIYDKGDWVGKIQGCGYGPNDNHTATNHWGYRHWLYFFMGLCLFIYNAFLIIEDNQETK